MKRYRTPKRTSVRLGTGFTIIETMIFLSVSGVIFLMTFVMLGNQQRATQFNQSVRDMESKINDISNDTQTGVYPLVSDVVCTTPASTIVFTIQAGAEPGENNDCVFVGNALQLVTDNASSSDYNVFALVGENSSTARSFKDISMQAYFSSGGGTTANFDSIQTMQLPWGTTVKRAYYMNGGAPVYVRGIAYLYSSFAGGTTGGTTATSGASSVSLYAVQSKSSPTSEANSKMNAAAFRTALTYDLGASAHDFVAPNNPIIVCLSGVGGRQAMIEIGSVSGSITASTNYNVSSECTV